MKLKRIAKIERITSETKIKLELNLDGSGKADVKTGIGFLDHMLDLWVFHSLFNLKLTCKGDLKLMPITQLKISLSLLEVLLPKQLVKKKELFVMVFPISPWMNPCYGLHLIYQVDLNLSFQENLSRHQ